MRIILTGGGTAGHVTPNIALIPKLKNTGFDVFYIGTKEGIEYNLIINEKIPFYPIVAGKLRRYFDKKNFTDIFNIGRGFIQALKVIKKEKPDVIFSKGGFVSCPVVWAGWLMRVPVVIHESDMTPGLANKLSLPFAKNICVAFPETENYINKSKCVLTGLPVREKLFTGKKEKGLEICNFDNNKPVILIIGGSLGSSFLNEKIRESLNTLLEDFQICHICGKNSLDESLNGIKGYKQFDYVSDEMSHLFEMSDLIVSRAGATTLFEILALEKPSLLVPLSKKASRGDQILNANSFEKKGLANSIDEDDMTNEKFINSIKFTYENRENYINKIKESGMNKGIDEVIKVITSSFLRKN
jgi:UDP-N-acetylglucosamine--N-acetylmuramyl-(pentapeptide) pyrophosphoryl-undecaprenol N-acetylglucosamine transferase